MSKNHNLHVSNNKRCLVHDDGTPFFYFADTAWRILHRLTREGADHDIERGAAQGCTRIQAVLLAGLRAWWSNPIDGSATDAGRLAGARGVRITTPEDNIGRDWVLVVDDTAAGYTAPGG